METTNQLSKKTRSKMIATQTQVDEPKAADYLSVSNGKVSCLYPARTGFWPVYQKRTHRLERNSLNLLPMIHERPEAFSILNSFAYRLWVLAGIHPLALQIVTSLETSFNPMAMPTGSHYTCGPFQLIKKNCPPDVSPVGMMQVKDYDSYITIYFESAGLKLPTVKKTMLTLDVQEQAARLFILTWASSAGKHFTKKIFPVKFVPYPDGMIPGLSMYETKFPCSHTPSSIDHARHIVSVLMSTMSPLDRFILVTSNLEYK